MKLSYGSRKQKGESNASCLTSASRLCGAIFFWPKRPRLAPRFCRKASRIFPTAPAQTHGSLHETFLSGSPRRGRAGRPANRNVTSCNVQLRITMRFPCKCNGLATQWSCHLVVNKRKVTVLAHFLTFPYLRAGMLPYGNTLICRVSCIGIPELFV